MAALDWIALAVLAASLLLGLWRGLIFEVLSLAGWVLAFVAASLWATDLAQHLPMGDSSEAWRLAAAFVLIFLGVVFGAGLLASGLRRLFSAVGLGAADRALGALFGLGRGLLVLLALTAVLRLSGLAQETWWREARCSAWLEAGLSAAGPWLPQTLAERLEEGAEPLALPPGLPLPGLEGSSREALRQGAGALLPSLAPP